MTEHAVHVDGLLKVFDVPERDEGLKAGTKSLVRRKTREVRVVDGSSFDIAPGEIVGFLGPNGAGKTTTLRFAAVFTVAAFAFSRWFWRFGLSRYSGASA